MERIHKRQMCNDLMTISDGMRKYMEQKKIHSQQNSNTLSLVYPVRRLTAGLQLLYINVSGQRKDDETG
jgi:hypothetical protein